MKTLQFYRLMMTECAIIEQSKEIDARSMHGYHNTETGLAFNQLDQDKLRPDGLVVGMELTSFSKNHIVLNKW